jgi:death on curing protein
LKPRFLTFAEVLLILEDQVRRYGGTYGVRDPALLSSALAMPSSSFEGRLLHSNVFEQAAAYAFHICQNHAFVDGNKRTALAAALVILDLNGFEVDDPKGLLYDLMMGVAQGTRNKAYSAKSLASHSKKPRQRKAGGGRSSK